MAFQKTDPQFSKAETARKMLAVALVLILGAYPVHAAEAAGLPVVGQVLAGAVQVDGVPVPFGSAIFQGSLLSTKGQPAVVGLSEGQRLHLAANSGASFNTTEDGVLISVQKGTVSFLNREGGVGTAGPHMEVLFPQRREGVAVPEELQGVVAALVEPGAAGLTRVVVNDASQIDATQRILIATLDGLAEGVYFIQRVESNVVHLTASLQQAFPAGAVVIQGDPVDEAVAQGVPVGGGGSSTPPATIPVPPPTPVTVGAGNILAILSGTAAGFGVGLTREGETSSPFVPRN